MALIKCPECNKEISDKSEVCIHCGYPLKKMNTICINGQQYNSDLFIKLALNSSNVEVEAEVIHFLICTTKCDFLDANSITQEIIKTKQVPEYINLKEETEPTPVKDNSPHCPICNSTDLSKITTTKKVAKTAAFGIFGMGDNGKTWKCNNCGSKF